MNHNTLVFTFILALSVNTSGISISKHKLDRNNAETEKKHYSNIEPSEETVLEGLRADPFEATAEEDGGYDAQEESTGIGAVVTGEAEVVPIGDVHHKEQVAYSNNTVYRSVPMPDQQADPTYDKPIQIPLPVNMPLSASRLIPLPVPQGLPVVMDQPVPVQKSIPVVIARPVPVAYPMGIAPKLSFPGFTGYAYPYRPGVRFARSKN